MQTEDLNAVKLLAQCWGDVEIIETLKDGTVSAGMKFIIIAKPRNLQTCADAQAEAKVHQGEL